MRGATQHFYRWALKSKWAQDVLRETKDDPPDKLAQRQADKGKGKGKATGKKDEKKPKRKRTTKTAQKRSARGRDRPPDPLCRA